MAIDLYSKGSVDTLLAAKLSDAPSDGSTYGRKDGAWEIVSGSGGLTINDLSNGATSTLDATVPTTGQALTFDGTNLVWATVGGGGGGGTWGAITGTLSDQTDLWTALGGKADLASPAFTGTTTFSGSWGTISIGDTPSGIQFPDSSIQTTAAVAGANLGDVFAMSIVKDVYWTGSAWQMTMEPVNPYLYYSGGMAVTDSSGSLFEWMSGMSTTSTWTYTTTTFGSTDYIYIQCLSQKSQNPCNYV